MQRTLPLPQRLGDFVKTLQELLDKGVSPETVVHVFDADIVSYQPVSLASYGGGSMRLHFHADEEYDDEIPRWQNEIRKLLVSVTPNGSSVIDGTGCESGDPLDVTLAEICQALAAKESASSE